MIQKHSLIRGLMHHGKVWKAIRGFSVMRTKISECACIMDSYAVDPCCLQPKVVILGAGIAGLSAAERLIQCGIKNLTILEALERPGGRIDTRLVGKSAVDLGATWILGACPGNTIYSLAFEDKLALTRKQKDCGICVLSSGRVVPSKVYNAAVLFFHDALRCARITLSRQQVDMSLLAYLKGMINKTVRIFPEGDRSDAKAAMLGKLYDVETIFGSDLDFIPASRLADMKFLPGGRAALQSGMKKVLSPLLKTVQDSRIKLNKVVKKIIWKGNVPGSSRAMVVTCDGESFAADYVIVTLPLGVLKCFHKDLFIPCLPESKQSAIERICVGSLNNILVRYKKPFWVPGEGYLRVCWTDEDLKKEDHWTHSIGMIEEVPTANDILKMMVSGKGAQKVEQMSDCQVIDDVTRMFRRVLGDSSLPLPIEMIRSKWCSSTYFKCGVSSLGQGSFISDLVELGSPILTGNEVAPVLLFAGEATSDGFHGTAHGARLSGLREAQRILNYTKCFCGPPPKDEVCYEI